MHELACLHVARVGTCELLNNQVIFVIYKGSLGYNFLAIYFINFSYAGTKHNKTNAKKQSTHPDEEVDGRKSCHKYN